MLLHALVSVLAGLAATAQATLVTGKVNATLEHDASASLSSLSSSSAYSVVSTPILHDSTFSLDLPADSYVLRIHSHRYQFQLYTITVPSGSDASVEARIYLPGPAGDAMKAGPPLKSPLLISPVGEKEYFEKPSDFNLYRIITGNPMLLLMGVGALLSMGMPWLMKQLDPEILQEVQQQQRDMHSKLTSYQNVDVSRGLSKYLSASGAEAEAEDEEAPLLVPPPVAAPAPVPVKSSGGGKGRKRK